MNKNAHLSNIFPYSKYRDLYCVLEYAESIGIKDIYFDILLSLNTDKKKKYNNGCIVKNEIFIDIYYNYHDKKDIICILIHELGHFLEDLTLSKQESKNLSNLYTKMITSKISKKELEKIYDHEKASWIMGISILNHLKLNGYEKHCKKMMKSSLRSYIDP